MSRDALHDACSWRSFVQVQGAAENMSGRYKGERHLEGQVRLLREGRVAVATGIVHGDLPLSLCG